MMNENEKRQAPGADTDRGAVAMRALPTTSDKATAWEIAARWVECLASDTETVDRLEVRCHLAAVARSMRQRAAIIRRRQRRAE